MTRILIAATFALALAFGATDGTSNTIMFGAATAKPTQALSTHLMEEEGLHYPGG